MSVANTSNSYGSVARALHWLTALLIAILIPLGIFANGLPVETGDQLARKAWLFSLHKTLGVTVFFVALARIGWMLSQPKPEPLHPDRKLETFAAETVHWALYSALLLVPLAGWIHHAATTGFAPIWWPFGQSLPMVPKSETLAHIFASLHIIFERVLVVSLVLHVAGALKHRIIDRDATLSRMVSGEHAEALSKGPARGHVPPILAAMAAYVAALSIGAMLGMFAATGAPERAQASLAEVTSDWRVETGSLSITVTQLGAPVTGSFETWTADIRYDPETGTGDVTVEIAIPSLTLGSVTAQALDTEFFDATTHPTATFSAEISRDGAGHVADGTLRLKGAELPVRLPFTLTLADGLAQMSGATTLDRLSFGIGPSYADASSVGLSVDVSVTLAARSTSN